MEEVPLTLHATPHAGRTLLATHSIPANTLLRTCAAPYASVIYREFRKVVCAGCFAHVDTSRTVVAGTDTPAVPGEILKALAGPQTPAGKYTLCAPGLGVWFCSEGCRGCWEREENVGGMLGRVWVAFGSAARRMKRGGRERVERVVGDDGNGTGTGTGGTGVAEDGGVTEGKGPGEVNRSVAATQKALDDVWKNAEEYKGKHEVVYLDDMELEIARFAASVIVRRFTEDTMPSISAPGAPLPSTPHLWSAFLLLQSNELAQYERFPDLLSTHLRVFAFLRWALPRELRGYVERSQTVREAFGRAAGNAFGVWEHGVTRGCGGEGGDDGDEERGEMFGWGIYVSASYFNHSCAPNVRKESSGREFLFYTLRDVCAGEELCISYIGGESVEERRKQLRENWYFECKCIKCDI